MAERVHRRALGRSTLDWCERGSRAWWAGASIPFSAGFAFPLEVGTAIVATPIVIIVGDSVYSGFDPAWARLAGICTPQTNPLLLPRLVDTTGMSELEFRAWLAGGAPCHRDLLALCGRMSPDARWRGGQSYSRGCGARAEMARAAERAGGAGRRRSHPGLDFATIRRKGTGRYSGGVRHRRRRLAGREYNQDIVGRVSVTWT